VAQRYWAGSRLDQHPYPGPGLQGIGENSAESTTTRGLTSITPSDSAKTFLPYSIGFYAKGFDGIDDANAGWKGRGLWTTSGDRTAWLMEGGAGSLPRAVHFQLRPDPMAH
jgi:hypothetical protein